jgi:hypothetical protein
MAGGNAAHEWRAMMPHMRWRALMLQKRWLAVLLCIKMAGGDANVGIDH